MTKVRLGNLWLAAAVAGVILCAVLMRAFYMPYSGFLRTVLYNILIFSWAVSVWWRILHAQTRHCLLGAAALMLFWLDIRLIRYDFAQTPEMLRRLWYAYYIPMLLIPTLALYTLFFLDRGQSAPLYKYRYMIFVFPVVLFSLVLTNDCHQLAFAFPPGQEVLTGVDLSKKMEKEEYKKELARLQARLSELHNELYKYRIPVVLAFEGWDAGGKGGAIKRLTQALDPRGYQVNPVAAPNDAEKTHHYLWRFWKQFPKDGHVAIFDRSWYGRVMVERIEGFCQEEEWKRAYHEMNEMEEQLAHHGTIVLKFWMHIDKDEQERRFKERMENPAKQWKITDEDWRNREKWDAYEKAVDEMLIRTSTTYAPWILVEADCKYYARIKVLRTVVEAIEKRLKEEKERK